MARFLRIAKRLERFGLGLVRINAHTHNRRVLARREALVDALIAEAQVDTLRALISGRLSIELLEAHAREHGLGGAGLAAQVALSDNLWDAMAAVLPRLGSAETTRKRYGVTRDQLRVRLPNAESLAVRDLTRVDWEALHRRWPGGASDWAHVRRFVSRFLSVLLGSKHHPVRHEVLARIPTVTEVERIPELTPAAFHQLVQHAREDIQPVLWTLVLTGMRVGEYLRTDVTHLRPAIHAIAVPGTKTKGAQALVRVSPDAWHFIEAAIPAPLAYKRLRELFKDALAAAGLPHTIRLHDLRHAHGQWAVEAGVPEALVQVSLRHTQASTTRRYTKQVGRSAVADGLMRALQVPGPEGVQ